MIKTTLENGIVVETLDLDENQHKAAVKAIENDLRCIDGYKIKEVDNETLEIWREDAENEGDDFSGEFYQRAIDNDAEVYTLEDDIQPIGDIIVY